MVESPIRKTLKSHMYTCINPGLGAPDFHMLRMQEIQHKMVSVSHKTEVLEKGTGTRQAWPV